MVQAALNQLPFPLRPPLHANGKANDVTTAPSFALLGGKYCSIQGVKAAQLKLRQHQSGIIHTLYIWPLTQTFKHLQAGAYKTDGVKVNVWADQHLLYGLARNQ